MTEPTPTTTTTTETEALAPVPARGLYCKMAAIMGEVQRMEKSGWNAQFKYSYVKGADVYDFIRARMAAYGIAFFVRMIPDNPPVIAREVQGQRSTGVHWLVPMIFTFVDAESGETESCEWFGESQDYQDKGLSKATGLAEKYFLIRTFMISTGEPSDDADSGAEDHQGAPNNDRRIPPDGQPGKNGQQGRQNNQRGQQQGSKGQQRQQGRQSGGQGQQGRNQGDQAPHRAGALPPKDSTPPENRPIPQQGAAPWYTRADRWDNLLGKAVSELWPGIDPSHAKNRIAKALGLDGWAGRYAMKNRTEGEVWAILKAYQPESARSGK